MINAKRLLLIALSMFSASCTPGDKVHLRGGEDLQMALLTDHAQPRTWLLRADQPAHARLAKWIEDNQHGWSPYMATTIARGLLVDSAEWRLQFVDDWAFACPRTKGCWQKHVEPEEYLYLMQSNQN